MWSWILGHVTLGVPGGCKQAQRLHVCSVIQCSTTEKAPVSYSERSHYSERGHEAFVDISIFITQTLILHNSQTVDVASTLRGRLNKQDTRYSGESFNLDEVKHFYSEKTELIGLKNKKEQTAF